MSDYDDALEIAAREHCENLGINPDRSYSFHGLKVNPAWQFFAEKIREQVQFDKLIVKHLLR